MKKFSGLSFLGNQEEIGKVVAEIKFCQKYFQGSGISFGYFEFNKENIQELEPMFKSLSTGVTQLDLGFRHLGKRTAEEIIAILAFLKNSQITDLCLGIEVLGEKTLEEQALILKSLNDSKLRCLNLGHDNFKNRTVDELKILFNVLKEGKIKTLEINEDLFAQRSCTEILSILNHLQELELQSLHIHGKNFWQKPVEELAAILKALGELGLSHIDLSDCFQNRNKQEITTLLDALRGSQVKHLNLSFNYFCVSLGVNDLIEILGCLEDVSLKSLDFAHNHLWCWKSRIEDIVKLLKFFTERGLSKLSLARNGLDKFTQEELLLILEALNKESLTKLNLSHNGLEEKTEGELKAICATLPENIKTLYLLCSELAAMNLAQREVLKARFPHPGSIVLLDLHGETLKPGEKREEANILRSQGIKSEVPTLRNLCLFSLAKKQPLSYEEFKELPEELSDGISSFYR